MCKPGGRLGVPAPEITPEQLVPLPQGTVLCRQPCYREEKDLEKPISLDKRTGPQIEVHPQRDRLVELLLQREAQINALARQAKSAAHLSRNSGRESTWKPRWQKELEQARINRKTFSSREDEFS